MADDIPLASLGQPQPTLADLLAATAGVAPAGPTPLGSAIIKGLVDTAAAPGRMMQQKPPQAGEMVSDEQEALRQINAAGQYNWGPQMALNMVGAPGGEGGLGSGARVPLTSLPMDEASRMARAAEQGYKIDAYKGMYPYDWRTVPERDWKGNIRPGTEDRVPQEITEFNAGKFLPNEGKGAGFFSNKPEVASRFADAMGEGAVYPTKLKMDNPKVIDAQGKFAADFQFGPGGDQLKLDANSPHDGVILKNTKDEGDVYIPRTPSQIRSRWAAFDPANEGQGFMLGSGSTDEKMSAALTGLNAQQQVPLSSPTIRAFHGSPHDFDRFDMSKIGTGEGAQAYGHGLYFAEGENVAKRYRDDLTPTRYYENGRELDPAEQNAASMLLDHKMSKEQALDYIDNALRKTRTADQEYLDKTTQALHSLDPSAITREARGKMYEVDINADPEHFLDWDKPLSEQSQKVQEALAGFGVKGDAADLGEFAGQKVQGLPRTGAEIYETLSGRVPGDLLSARGDRPGTTQALREAGIPGIKYLDQGSRGTGAGTSNYVVFDDKLIDILKKYGLAGLLGSGAMGLGTQQQPQQ